MNAAVRVRFKNGGYRAHPSEGIAEFVPIGKHGPPRRAATHAFVHAFRLDG